ncbi:unnamed protein product [Acanthoscelides obtectus]|uniref:Uncharacterized protein n=1 Tax=Acanthoscelides obtectus TaxID=200917 RepID=A0A9P0PDC3_ACAOB|nr:unnamed protein product [Acanthoscelides obtectus]CAK1641199.1 hypothetical protein AOBTE_LOCUS12232 [Acanthoscelides obtectus]
MKISGSSPSSILTKLLLQFRFLSSRIALSFLDLSL